MKTHLSVLLILSTSFFGQTAVGQETIMGSFEHDGTERNYRLFLPSDYSSDEPTALVFNLHGYTSNASQQELYSNMNEVAEAENFLVCYPNGVGNAWNVGWAFGSEADDVGFISALIDSLSANYAIDPERVYSCGMSNGGFMSYRLACELNDRIAAVASVTGSIAPQYFSQCDPARPVPIMEIHGTADFVVPYGGSAFLAEPIEEVVHFWVENNGCQTQPDTTDIPDIDTNDSSTAIRIDFTECEEDSKVSFIKITEGGHTWPGAFPLPTSGATNQDFEASEVIWEFFKACAPVVSAVENKTENQTVIFPNPVLDELYFRAENGATFERYQIFDGMGRLVLNGKFETMNQGPIEVGRLHPGVHILVLFKGHLREQFLFLKG